MYVALIRNVNKFANILIRNRTLITTTNGAIIIFSDNYKRFINNNSKMYYCQDIGGGPTSSSTSTSSNNKMKIMMGNIKKDDKDSVEALEKYDSNSWRTIRNSLIIFGVTFTLIGSYLIYTSGTTKYDSNGAEIIDEYTDRNLFVKYLSRTYKELKLYQKMISEPSREKLLPDILPDPYYQPPYTLVMEFTDLIVHPEWTYSTGWRFKKRPGFEQFLQSLQGLYEIVIYTSEMGVTVFPIIEALDQSNIISYKLVRDATQFTNGRHLKDLNRLNRDLSRVIVVDWQKSSTTGHADNVLILPRWKGNDNDVSLIDLSNFLRVIAYSEVEDVREVLRYYSQYDDPLLMFRNKQRQLAEEANEKNNSKSSTTTTTTTTTATLKTHILKLFS